MTELHHERPCIVEERSRIGDWEADTVIGQHHKQAIVTLVERKTGLLKMKRVGHKTAQQVSEAMIELLAPVRLQVKTITSDNGKEFAQHRKVKNKSSLALSSLPMLMRHGSEEPTKIPTALSESTCLRVVTLESL